jgi:spore germination protein
MLWGGNKMHIHVVKPGESLWSISKSYGLSPNELARLNKIPNQNNLVSGQTIVIPSPTELHTIKPGESLWAIAKKHNLALQNLLNANPGINPNRLKVGEQIRISSSPVPARTIEVNAYIDPMSAHDPVTPIREVAKHLTYLSMFSYHVTSQGNIVGPEDKAIVAAARAQNVAPVLVVTNFDGTNFSPELAHSVMSVPEIRGRLISNLIATMRSKGYRVLNMDFERIKPENRQMYNAFLLEVGNKVRAAGFPFSTALAPKTSDWMGGEWHGAHDYRAHGAAVDFTILMTYEWGWSGGPAYAVAPINKVKEVLDYAVTVIPRKKIVMGMPLYGYDWTLPYVRGGHWAKAVSPQQAIELAAVHGVPIKYDEKLQSPHFNYFDKNGKEHVVWFEDARSVNAKFDLVNEYGLRGVSYWVLGHDFPQNWLVLESRFRVKKL